MAKYLNETGLQRALAGLWARVNQALAAIALTPGPPGPKGDKGDTGSTGAKGDKGDTGATGPQGPAGSDANIAMPSSGKLMGMTPAQAFQYLSDWLNYVEKTAVKIKVTEIDVV